MSATAMLKVALVLFSTHADFTQSENIVRVFDQPSECMAMYIDHLAKASHGDVRYLKNVEGGDIYYECRYVDADLNIMPPNFGTASDVIVIHGAPPMRQQPDFVIEERIR